MKIQAWLAGACAALALANVPTPSVRAAEPSFASGQAQFGSRLFATKCAACHGARLQGVADKGPPLVGSPIGERHWPLNLLFSYISHQMPANARGTLRRDDYVALLAFLLLENGHHAGHTALRAAQLKNTRTYL